MGLRQWNCNEIRYNGFVKRKFDKISPNNCKSTSKSPIVWFYLLKMSVAIVYVKL